MLFKFLFHKMNETCIAKQVNCGYFCLVIEHSHLTEKDREAIEERKEIRKRKRGRPKKSEIKAKKQGNRGPVGRPKGDAAIINEYKARMLASPKSKLVALNISFIISAEMVSPGPKLCGFLSSAANI